jgi:RHS repeat-associated protein
MYPFQFTGRLLSTGSLYNYRSRYYNAESGRFIREDPVGLLGGPNLYAYVGNSPINFPDPYGLRACRNVISWHDHSTGKVVLYYFDCGDDADIVRLGPPIITQPSQNGTAPTPGTTAPPSNSALGSGLPCPGNVQPIPAMGSNPMLWEPNGGAEEILGPFVPSPFEAWGLVGQAIERALDVWDIANELKQAQH